MMNYDQDKFVSGLDDISQSVDTYTKDQDRTLYVQNCTSSIIVTHQTSSRCTGSLRHGGTLMAHLEIAYASL